MPNVSRALLLPPFPTFRADVFHALNQRVDRRPAKRVISTFHDLFVLTGDYSTPAFRKRFSEQARRAVERSDLIIAVSNFTARQLRELLLVEEQRIRVIPHGVVLPADLPRDAEREPLVLFVGAIQARKNVTALVEAFESMSAPWRLVLAGATTGYRAQQILDRIAASKSRDRIEVTGYLPQHRLKSLLARASLFAFPSLDEGFGIPVLEAMAAGIPVVTSRTSALAEIAHDAALLVDPHETDEIASALNRLATDQELRKELVHKGRIRAAEYTWEEASEKTYRVYRELAG